MKRRAPRSSRPTAKPAIPPAPARGWGPAAFYFLAGLLCRLVVFTGRHFEGDEIVYRTLVHQLETGHSYTLRGTSLIGNGWPADQYGNALFFHPPGGVALFWLLHRAFGEFGYPLAQVLGYGLFFWSMLALARVVLGPLQGARLHIVAALAAFTPIMTHVTSRHWLDGPMLAFSTLAGALFLSAARRGDTRRALLAALVMGYASWIKSAALVVVPGLLLLAWAMGEPAARRLTVRLGLIFAALAVLLQLPWQLWQLHVVGSAFPAWAGKPSPELVTTNPYVYKLTVLRPPWMYLTLMPRVIWTLVPSIACLSAPRLDLRVRRIALALLAWIAIVLALVIGLGFLGYSMVLRYAILVTPATLLLFGLVATETWTRLSDPRLTGGERMRALGLVALAAAGIALEIAQGIYTPMVDDRALINPLLWRGNGIL